MKGNGARIAFAVLIAAVLVWAVQYFSGEERRIRRRLAELEELVGKAEGEGDLVGANKVRKLGELFTQDFEITIIPYSVSVSDRGELMRVAMGYRHRSRSATLAFRDVEIAVDSAATNAETAAVAVISGHDGKSTRRESYRVAFSWNKVGGEWLVRRLEVLEVLEGTPSFL